MLEDRVALVRAVVEVTLQNSFFGKQTTDRTYIAYELTFPEGTTRRHILFNRRKEHVTQQPAVSLRLGPLL